MSSFPPAGWEVLHLQEMAKFRPAISSSATLTPTLAVRPSASNEGDYAFLISGSEPFPVKVKASDILPTEGMER